MYGLVIVHEDGCVLSVRVPEAEARYRFEKSQKVWFTRTFQTKIIN